jgi:hypothetical protein
VTVSDGPDTGGARCTRRGQKRDLAENRALAADPAQRKLFTEFRVRVRQQLAFDQQEHIVGFVAGAEHHRIGRYLIHTRQDRAMVCRSASAALPNRVLLRSVGKHLLLEALFVQRRHRQANTRV